MTRRRADRGPRPSPNARPPRLLCLLLLLVAASACVHTRAAPPPLSQPLVALLDDAGE